ncbi:endoplasmic reticulum vesicle transporter-domain-containing protein [Dipodascopsis uninucleata]
MYIDKMSSQDSFSSRVRTFDAFPKVSSTYTTRSSQGGATTILLGILCLFLIWTEMGAYFSGIEDHEFVVDSSVGSDMQVNIDITVAMACDTLHVNVQDSSGDRLLAAELIDMQAAEFDLSASHELTLESREQAESDDDLQSVFRRAKAVKKFKKHRDVHPYSPACRIYGSLKVNKVQGDLHITARNYAYMDMSRELVPQEALNFSHVIDELSFGAYYPKLNNPLDGVAAIIDTNMFRYQYYISVVPTTYRSYSLRRIVETNQYAVTEEPLRLVNPHRPPGIFFKYDIEPISVLVTERRIQFLQFLIRLVNVIGGVVVCTGWFFPIVDKLWNKFTGRKHDQDRNKTMLDTGIKRND